ITLCRRAKAYVKKHEGELAQSKQAKDIFAKYTILLTNSWHRLKREVAELVVILTPWEMRIKRIESHFGSVVASYFTFLRWVFWLNCFIALFVCCFLMVPEVLRGDDDPSGMRKQLESEEMESALNLQAIWEFEGYLKYSPIFYGYYSNRDMTEEGYRLPLAYLLSSLTMYIFSFFVILRKMAANSRQSKMTEKEDECTFTWKLFSGWDFMIGNSETAHNKVASLVMSFKVSEAILEEKERKKEERSWKIMSLRALANFIVIILLASSAYAVVLVVERSQEPEAESSWYRQNEVTLVVSMISNVYPNLFDVIGLMEQYHPRIQLRWQLARILVLYLLNLYTLIFALFGKVMTMVSFYFITSKTSTTTTEPSTRKPGSPLTPEDLLKVDEHTKERLRKLCWETMFGQEIVKLTIMDLVMTIASTLITDFIRALIVRYANDCWCWDLEQGFPGYGDFKIAENILHLVNNQGMVWMGMFFSPGLPAINTVKLCIMMYVRSWAVLTCNIPHETVFKASGSNNFYFMLLLIMLFVCTLPVGYAMVWLEPSWHCGPFRQVTCRRSSGNGRVFTTYLDNTLPTWMNQIIEYLTSPGVVIPLILLLMYVV
ncbi:conserved hypothetical protein, partial [Ixodes scapularis]